MASSNEVATATWTDIGTPDTIKQSDIDAGFITVTVAKLVQEFTVSAKSCIFLQLPFPNITRADGKWKKRESHIYIIVKS